MRNRAIQNSKQASIGEKDFYPSDMPEGEMLIAAPKGKPLRLYKKFKGLKWWANFTKDGDTHLDKRLIQKGKTLIDENGRQDKLMSRQTLLFGYDSALSYTGSGSTVADAHTIDGSANTLGYRAIRKGWVTGISVQCNCTDASPTGQLRAYVQKNGTNQIMYALGDGTSVATDIGGVTTSSPFSFVGGDKINVELQALEDDAAGVAFDDIAIIVEIQT